VLHGLAKHKTINGVRVGTPDYLSKWSELYQALKASGGKMVSFGVDFGAKPTENGRGAAVLFVLIILVVLTGFWQVRQMTSRTANMNPQMQIMNRITPFMSGFFSLQLPGGVTVYFLISNLFRVTTQSLMYRFDPHLSAHMDDVREIKSKAANEPPQPKKGLMASLREQAEARESNRRPSANGNGSAPKSNGTSGPRPSAGGRVTQPGQRGNAPRKRNKKKR
jgi:membrane protein insertase Oxa1/YidC/SpoIIIJ